MQHGIGLLVCKDTQVQALHRLPTQLGALNNNEAGRSASVLVYHAARGN